MSNQVLLWIMFFVPWLSLLLMKKKEVKRYMPVALLSALTSVIIHEAGIAFNWWSAQETAYPLQLMPYLIGLNPVLTLWIFKFTFRKFWLFVLVEAVTNAGFNFLFLSQFLPARNILQYNINPFIALLITMGHGLSLYAYQLWQDGVFIRTVEKDKQA